MPQSRSIIVKLAATPLGFTVKFIVCFALLYGAFEASRGSAFERVVVENLILMPTTALINVVTLDEHATLVAGRVISAPGSNLHVAGRRHRGFPGELEATASGAAVWFDTRVHAQRHSPDGPALHPAL